MPRLREAPLTPGAIVKALDVFASPAEDPKVVDDVYELAQRQLTSEDTHAARLDSRATSLFNAVGFSITVAFSFGGWSLLDNIRKLRHGLFIGVAFIVVLAAGIIAGAYALSGLLLRYRHRYVDVQQVFNAQIMTSGQRQIDFRIHLAADLWAIWQDRRAKSEERAALIQTGQKWFFAFLVGILVLSGLTTWSALTP